MSNKGFVTDQNYQFALESIRKLQGEKRDLQKSLEQIDKECKGSHSSAYKVEKIECICHEAIAVSKGAKNPMFEAGFSAPPSGGDIPNSNCGAEAYVKADSGPYLPGLHSDSGDTNSPSGPIPIPSTTTDKH